MSNKTVTLDVREDLQRGREPFGKIMQTVAALKPNEELLLIAPFQPTPLFGVLAQRGYGHEATQLPSGDWEVRFSQSGGKPSSEAPKKPTPKAAGAECTGSPVLDVDARGLEPPGPLVKILEAIATLPAGVTLRAHTDRRPMHLYAQLEERGFHGETEEQKDGSFITKIRRA